MKLHQGPNLPITTASFTPSIQHAALEAITVIQAIKRIIAVVEDHNPTLSDITVKVDVHDRPIDQGPYQRADE